VTIPEDRKDQAIYHTILSDMHRMQAMMLNLQTMTDLDTAEALREHFTREQNLTLARLNEWRQRRPELYREAGEDFQHQIRRREGAQPE
jgi:hypothetical protein